MGPRIAESERHNSTSRLAPWNPSFLGDFDMFSPSGYVKIAIEMAIDIVTIVDFPIENGDFP